MRSSRLSGSSLFRTPDLPRRPKASGSPGGSLELRSAGRCSGPGFLIDGPPDPQGSEEPSPSADFPAGTVVANVAGEVGA